VRLSAVSLQRPFVIAASCTMSGSNLWPKTFSSVILTAVDLGLRFHKHNARLNVILAMLDTPTDTVITTRSVE